MQLITRHKSTTTSVRRICFYIGVGYSCLKSGGGSGLGETELVVLGDLCTTDTIWHLNRLTVYKRGTRAGNDDEGRCQQHDGIAGLPVTVVITTVSQKYIYIYISV